MTSDILLSSGERETVASWPSTSMVRPTMRPGICLR